MMNRRSFLKFLSMSPAVPAALVCLPKAEAAQLKEKHGDLIPVGTIFMFQTGLHYVTTIQAPGGWWWNYNGDPAHNHSVVDPGHSHTHNHAAQAVPVHQYEHRIWSGKRWVPCDGRALSIAEEPELFAVISNRYSTPHSYPVGKVFNVPEMREPGVSGVFVS